MRSRFSSSLLLLEIALMAGAGWAEDAGPKKKARTGNPMAVEEVESRLGERLTEEQRTKLAGVNAALKKKLEESDRRPEVQAAQTELGKAAGAAAVKAARKKLAEARGFDFQAEYRAALGRILNERQMNRLLPPPKEDEMEEEGG
jgi:hypothetical protein